MSSARQLGIEHYKAQRFEQAVAAFEQAQAEEPRAKRLYEEANVIKSSDPTRSLRLLEEAQRLVPADHIYHSKARKLHDRIQAGQ